MDVVKAEVATVPAEKYYDVVDVLTILNGSFRFLEFETEDQNIDGYTTHVFKLKRLNTHVLEKPVKTSISLRQNQILNADEFQKIKQSVENSFDYLVPKIAVFND